MSDTTVCTAFTTADVIRMRTAIAQAAAVSPVSSIATTAIAATLVSGAYRKITAATVVIAFTKKYVAMSTIAGRHTGIVTRRTRVRNGTPSDADAASNSSSSCFTAVSAVMCGTV